MMTNQEFRAAHGQKCPFCESENIFHCCGSEIESTEQPGVFTAMVECNDCKKDWEEILQLTGYKWKEK
jgi:transposase-like protein